VVAIELQIHFHGPFRVATGLAGRGSDTTVDLAAPLKGSSLKGAMRASARQLLAGRGDLVEAVFGSPRQPSPWSWSSAQMVDPALRRRARVAIDPDRHVAAEQALFVAEELWATRAAFQIQPLTRVTDQRRDELILMASAHGVHALGGDRRRGLGWVTIQALQPTFDDAAFQAFLSLRSQDA
jgi:CRISPR/Cas system CSM-associated protein Csm3 (group 7 of RAMP superfamily)